MTSHPRLTIRELRVRGVNVPLALPLQTSGGTVNIAPLALIDLFTEEGVTGTTYLFCYTPFVLGRRTDAGRRLRGSRANP